ncbi:tryptophan 2,3-dioxygenase family protein [Myroides odoratimimus]|uniref:tryptophan 2,3-dioxygenase family protein n=1 Tax=Myroides TaxID=76831 RepID=UPI000353D0D4|nr:MULTISPECIES: tryptophan 2,3-dioxygenase family protein [Myroides]EPH10535.1 tryptophan 2,3-dioxygenase [Myroides odoratimimus CCUG 12700]MCO7721709.1 tryptophan 2,3-dioxygenase family protein [Myroides odoratimimus]MCS7472827.1 tryptophan 2,3-dioxygenase family protein [Myroides odoratimimus]MDM1508482.1 tryptophan 2,3-dioxygenase [Myroides odoratimimus]MDM1518910.1 tryptophan 2,3-dioxygenase [Myroides odoratimimus]
MIDKKFSEVVDRFNDLGIKAETQIEGMLYAKPITYWDYIQTDALLNLQTQRTVLPDEMVFIMYHQVNELLFKMILWELNQVSECNDESLTVEFFKERLARISRYFDMLTSSFTIMKDGMEVEQYLKFRNTLAPASGFQSSQYRLIEFGCTDWINLIDKRFVNDLPQNISEKEALEYMYWQAAGKDYKTGEKSYLLKEFENRYCETFVKAMKDYEKTNLWQKFVKLPLEAKSDKGLIEAMRHFDKTVNVVWVMGHYEAALKYLESNPGETKEATGGSDWKKYMLPQYQKRIFFPELWSDEEKANWGK